MTAIQVVTLEGNTNQQASRTGGQVARLRRSVDIVGYGMPLYSAAHPIKKLLDAERHELGYSEGANNHTKYGDEYGMDHEPWCDIFQSVMGKHAFGSYDVVGHFAYCPDHMQWFKDKHRWSSYPQAGALGFVYSHDLGRVGHVFLVESVVNWTPPWYRRPLEVTGPEEMRGADVSRVRAYFKMAHAGAYTSRVAEHVHDFTRDRGMYVSSKVGTDVARAIG